MTSEAWTKLGRIWTPSALADQGPRLVYWRLRLLSTAAWFLLAVVVPAYLIARFVFHLPVPVELLFAALAVYMSSMAARQAAGISLAFHSGRLMGFRRQVASRADHPLRFWTWVTLHAVTFVGYLAFACALTWFAAGLPLNF